MRTITLLVAAALAASVAASFDADARRGGGGGGGGGGGAYVGRGGGGGGYMGRGGGHGARPVAAHPGAKPTSPGYGGRHWGGGGHPPGYSGGRHGGHYRSHGHYGHYHGGYYPWYPAWSVGIGLGFGWPYWGWGYGGWGYGPYGWPVDYVEAPVYVNPDPMPSYGDPSFRWYCPASAAYYPDVRECARPWLKVVPADRGPAPPPVIREGEPAAPADAGAPAEPSAPADPSPPASPSAPASPNTWAPGYEPATSLPADSQRTRIAAPRMTPPAQLAARAVPQPVLAQATR